MLDRFLSARTPAQIALLASPLVAVVGAFDLLTGYELSFSVFYTLPIGVAAWYAGRRIGLIFCIIGAVAWVVIDVVSGHQYSHPAIPIWNGGVRLAFFVIISSLLTRLREALHQQTLLAERDGLTGIMNARAFRHQCDSLFKLAGRHRRPIVLAYLDLDGFKGINDRLGHSVGDQVLKTIAAVLEKHLRGSDVCARVGGDEFAILLPETGLAGARQVFSELRRRLVEVAGLNSWPLGFSIGVAVFGAPAVGTDAAIRRADELMYRVKKSGKNGTVFEEVTALQEAPEDRPEDALAARAPR